MAVAEAVKRLGESELGPHAFELHMPARVAALVETETSVNKLHNVIPQLAQYLEASNLVHAAYFCDDGAVQVYKVPGEGSHFCAYRSIQMILPFIRTIPDLQCLIEEAWEAGHNAHGRVETGGIIGTRKHIGASEIEAILLHLGIACTGHHFAGPTACEDLLDMVEKYFSSSIDSKVGERIFRTKLRPIFLQRPQHSLTIVGLQRNKSGRRQLFVFDPAHDPPGALRHPSSIRSRFHSTRLTLLRYRIGEPYLKHFQQFETVCINGNLPSPPDSKLS